MPAYSFEAIDAQGLARKGVLEADTARSARGLLRAQALIPLSVTAVGSVESGVPETPNWRRLFGGGRIFNSTTLAVWTRQIAGLVSSGLSLEQSIRICACT